MTADINAAFVLAAIRMEVAEVHLPTACFDSHSLEELAARFRAQGVLQSLLVRTIEDDKYDVIAGARRLRAAKLTELEEVPARIAGAFGDPDIEVLECQLIENGHREGVHCWKRRLPTKRCSKWTYK